MSDPHWQALPVPVIVLDARDEVADLNAAAEGFLNRSGRALSGLHLPSLVQIEGGLDVATARVRRQGAPLTLHDTDLRVGPAPAIRCEVHLALNGEDVLLLLSPREIAGRLDRARSSRSAARSAIGMAEMLAHEIKNPLAGITGAAQLLDMNLSEEDRELTDLIVVESRRIVKLLEQVEQFGNLRPPQRRAVNVHDVLDRARRSAMVGFASHMTLREAYDPSLPPVWIDPDQLAQVVLNLLKNAAQVGAQDGRITIRTFYDGTLRVRRADGARAAAPVQVEIADDGPGIAPEIAANLFEPFVSGRENGTGLGLALVAKIVAEHDGLIAVDSVPGRTVFRISLPLAAKDETDKGEG
ncbi:PAS domain-containing sensor histidine kinase [Jannaschia sp. Os4]|uniref:two-component system sensor histidine kinase NtrB n=1 Tax=Jannaschia sp. Os4 TaxID=2807617 RepID=UPI0019397AB0|nr:ATP-binding protein [Jannaschia sp. Os4]MBM2576502.1 PAS domain-containing sensor histidine kinase [Jannaschia sp. Os4]